MYTNISISHVFGWWKPHTFLWSTRTSSTVLSHLCSFDYTR